MKISFSFSPGKCATSKYMFLQRSMFFTSHAPFTKFSFKFIRKCWWVKTEKEFFVWNVVDHENDEKCLIRHKNGENWFMNFHHHRRRRLVPVPFQSIYSDKWLCNAAWVVMNDVQHEDENWDKLLERKIELWKREKRAQVLKFSFPFFTVLIKHVHSWNSQSMPISRISINIDVKLVVSFRSLSSSIWLLVVFSIFHFPDKMCLKLFSSFLFATLPIPFAENHENRNEIHFTWNWFSTHILRFLFLPPHAKKTSSSFSFGAEQSSRALFTFSLKWNVYKHLMEMAS